MMKEKILNIVILNPYITMTDISDKLNKPLSTVSRYVEILFNKGIVYRTSKWIDNQYCPGDAKVVVINNNEI